MIVSDTVRRGPPYVLCVWTISRGRPKFRMSYSRLSTDSDGGEVLGSWTALGGPLRKRNHNSICYCINRAFAHSYTHYVNVLVQNECESKLKSLFSSGPRGPWTSRASARWTRSSGWTVPPGGRPSRKAAAPRARPPRPLLPTRESIVISSASCSFHADTGIRNPSRARSFVECAFRSSSRNDRSHGGGARRKGDSRDVYFSVSQESGASDDPSRAAISDLLSSEKVRFDLSIAVVRLADTFGMWLRVDDAHTFILNHGLISELRWKTAPDAIASSVSQD